MVELLLQLEATKLLIRTTLLTCGSIPINLKGQQITSAYPTYNIPYPYLPALVLNPPHRLQHHPHLQGLASPLTLVCASLSDWLDERLATLAKAQQARGWKVSNIN